MTVECDFYNHKSFKKTLLKLDVIVVVFGHYFNKNNQMVRLYLAGFG